MKGSLLVMLVLVLGCENKQSAAPEPAKPVESTDVAKPEESVPKQAAGLAVKTPDGKVTPFVAMLAWNMDAAGSKVPQLEFHTESADCADRAQVERKKFYTSFLGDFVPAEDGEPYNAPNWGYSALPDFVPGSADDQGYPPPYWGKVTIAKADDKTVSGTVDFADKGVEVKGNFVAKLCPEM